MGRHVVDDDNTISFDWPGVRLEFSEITGTSAVAIRMSGGGSVFGYQLNQEPPQILTCFWNRKSQKTYNLAQGLDPCKSYELQLWKRDDPNGVVKVSGLVLDTGGTCSPSCTQTARKLIEFIGDSDTVGFGNLASKSGMVYSILFQLPLLLCGVPKYIEATDASVSWPAHVAQTLGVDYNIVAESGIGAKYSEGVHHNMIDVYPRQLNGDFKSSSKHSLQPVDAVVVYIGMNDLSHLKSSFQSTEKSLLKAFCELLTVIRSVRSNCKIIIIVPHEDAMLACVTSKRENKKACKIQNKIWRRAVEKMGGEEKGFYVVQNRHEPQIKLNSHEDYGMMLHWNAASCQKWASGLTENLQRVLTDDLARS